MSTERPAEEADESVGLPILSTWPRVYAFVLALFLISVLLLFWLTRAYS